MAQKFVQVFPCAPMAKSEWTFCPSEFNHCCCSVTQLCPTLCNPMDCSTPGLHVPHHLPKFVQVHIHLIGDALQPSHPLMPSSPSALNLSQKQGLFQWVICMHQMTKILEFKLQHQSFHWVQFSSVQSLSHVRLFATPWIAAHRIDFLKIDWLDLLAVQRTLKSLLQHHSSKASILRHSAFFMV